MDIFYNIKEQNKSAMLNCLRAVKKTFLKDEIIFNDNETPSAVAYIEKGAVRIIKNDYDGNNVIVADFGKGEVFGEAMVVQKLHESCIVAIEDTEVLFMDFSRILTTCQNSCPFHRKLIENFVKNIVEKNMLLQKKIELLSKKTLRERILNFLYDIRKEQTEDMFKIPYSREQMADFICANRSALSRELAKMKEEGLLDYHKNSFKIFYL